MKSRPSRDFGGVPRGPDWQPLNRARAPEDSEMYVDWLADYLYRPKPQMPSSAILSLEQAWPLVSQIEVEIAGWIWDHPFDDHPPDSYQPRHADILHRPELSKILSRVPKYNDRREILQRFYVELATDAMK